MTDKRGSGSAQTEKGERTMPDRKIDITVDQLIADLCIIRGKTPEFGTMKLYNCSTDCGQFSLSATDGDKIYTITIEPKNCADWLKRDLLKEQEAKTGYWIDSAGNDKCSNCGAEYSDLYPDYGNTHFCPNCGAKMERR